MTNLDSILKSKDIALPTKIHSLNYGFYGSHVWMWMLDHKYGQMLKNWCFWAMVLEKTFESPLDCKVIKPINPKGNQSLILIRMTDTEAEAPKLWSPDVKNRLIGKDPVPDKDWSKNEKDTTEYEIIGCIIKSVSMSLNKVCEMVKGREAWGAAVHGVAESDIHWVTKQQASVVRLLDCVQVFVTPWTVAHKAPPLSIKKAGGGGQLLSHSQLFALWPHGLLPARTLCPLDSPSMDIFPK